MFKQYKNFSVYRLSRDMKLEEEALKTALPDYQFSPCGSQDMARTGFTSPLGSDMLYFAASGFIALTVQREKKLLPGHVIKAELNQKIGILEATQGRKLKKTEKDSLKDEVIHSLLPRAFTATDRTQILYSSESNLLFINSGPRRSEDALAMLRKALGSLPVVPLTLENPIELTLTEWVRNDAPPAGYSLGEKADLKAILDDGGSAKLNKQDLSSDEVKTLIAAGKLVTKLSLCTDRVNFAINDGAGFSGVKFSDELLDQNSDIDVEDELQRSSADIILLAGELDSLTSKIVAALGGEASR
ncbi:recombination-associated protein RdgC [Citrobacter braakii]|nr:recombination-associated protein RdgC [Citrobacter braakii]